ncbi:MAG: diguanylate cyclase [Sulfuricurvum sp.]|uniref:diguanylate cyclase n=1 Tax=Sulfuricurvum sp. TaxID=2025608 RepID=UPI00262246AE|nr:diguanylate cyclase [Sulfuricurvum sp.]MDD2828091.1 diguanylate cyclase [Sulfuricurvum sp.]MDD4948035.1 diguanylate cyclase [Sulfuricurvum sp.]
MFFPTLGLIATTNVITVDIHHTIQDALDKMHHHNHRSVVVVNKTLHYIITTKDIIRLKLEGTTFSTPLSQISLRPLPMVDKDSNIISALNLTNEMDEHICVCNVDGSLYGLVTNSDIVASVDPQVILDTLQIATIFDKKYGYKSFPPYTPMIEVLEYMKDSLSDCVIIQEGSLPLGILTSKDILRFIGDESAIKLPISDVMSTPVDTLSATASIGEGLEYLKSSHFKRIVVTDDEGKVMGIVTQQDLISRTYLKWSQLMQDHFRQFEEITQILQQKNHHLTQLATKDSLTQIHNRHMFTELFAKELSILKRQSTKLSLLMMDLDHFKRVNDTHGHNMGDLVLKQFSELVSSLVRESDLFARWGGEEFVLLLRNSGCEEGYSVGEKIRLYLEAENFDMVGQITCSIGITEVNSEDTIQSAIERADNALYSAKDAGRNRTIACEVHQ